MDDASGQRLAGKTAVITGGTTGIGFETAKRYLTEGAKVMITGANPGRMETALEALGPGATGCVADVTDVAALDAMAAQAKADLGRVDILFANAGFGIFAPIEDVDEAAYDRQFGVNVKGVFFTVKKIIPLMGKGGSIILNASAVNAKGASTGSLYFATKAAVRSFARSLAAELGERGIRVNSLSPGVVRTRFSANTNLGEEDFEGFVGKVIDQLALKRAGGTDDITGPMVFLGSDESAYMTAADLVIDGGFMNL